ncbi:MAG: zf-HC2 domain-containing protein [Ignavibacteria bacterium]|nr:zf-HC2 domain-containing protein [Ignavibacteria bacterium]
MSTNKSTTRNFCDETERLIDDYLEGNISPKDKEIMDSHVDSCEDCKGYLEATSKLKLQLGSLSTNYEYLSSSEKDELWKGVESKVDFEKRQTEELNKNFEDPAYRKYGLLYKYRYYASAFAALIVVGMIFFAVKNFKFESPVLTKQDSYGLPSYWKVTSLSGTPFISEEAMAKLDSIRDGEYIITNDSSRAELFITDIGKVLVEPNTKLMIVKGKDGRNKLSVIYGTIDADMKKVQEPVHVELPSAIAMDDGGSYKVTVDGSGDGLFYVKSGQVEVVSGNKQSVVPAGSLVMTKKDKGVGTPFSNLSSSVFKKALYNFDFGNCDVSCVTTILNSANKNDAVSLVNMITQVEEQYKDRVYAKVASFVPPPHPVHRDSIPFIDEKEIEDWVTKIEADVQANIEKNMKHLEENLENLKQLEFMTFDTLKWADDLNKKYNVKVKVYDNDFEFVEMPDSVMVYFDKEEFKQEMEELNKELEEDMKERNADLKIEMKELNDELNEELKNLNEELKDAGIERNEELRKELDKARQEVERALKEVGEKVKVEVNTNEDGKVEVKVNTDAPEKTEAPEPPETPDK